MRGGDGVSDVEIRRNEIIELLFSTATCKVTVCKASRQSWKQRAHSQPAATPNGQRKASSVSCKMKNTAVMCCCKRPLPRMC